MKLFLFIILTISFLNANEELWSLKKFNFSMENDADFETDFSYTHGGRVSLLFSRENMDSDSIYIPFTDISNKDHFISFSYANQMYVPYDRESSELVKDDRPYAGWNYIEVGLHQSTSTELDSLTLSLGVIGSSSRMQELQNTFHDWIDARYSAGWDNQLKDEMSVQLNYIHKWQLKNNDILGLNSVLTPYSGVYLGNVSLKASAGALYRIGLNIPNDFGVNSMNEGSFPSLPTKDYLLPSDSWSVYLNFLTGVNLIARDIFVDGNTFKDSHFVQRYPYNAYIASGISFRYKKFTLNYWHQYYTKDYKLRGKYEKYMGYGSLLLEYDF